MKRINVQMNMVEFVMGVLGTVIVAYAIHFHSFGLGAIGVLLIAVRYSRKELK